MKLSQFPLDSFVNNRLQRVFKEQLSDFELYEQLRQLVYQTNDLSVTIMYANLGCEIGEYDEVIDVIENYFPNTNDQELDRVYLMALVQAWQLEKAQDVLDVKYAYYNELGYSTDVLDAIGDEIAHQFDALDQEDIAQKEAVLKQIQTIDTLSYVQQQHLVPKLRLLSGETFVSAVKKLLQSDSFHPLLKAYVLDQLVSHQNISAIDMLFYGEQKNVDVANLSHLEDTPYYKALENTMATYHLSAHDQNVILHNARLYLALSYPFEKMVFKSCRELVEVLISQHHQQETHHEWLVLFEQAINQMTI